MSSISSSPIVLTLLALFLAMSGDDIYMDYFSVLGPIDPQLPKDDKMVPALGYLEQYDRLIRKSAAGTLTTAELAFLINRFDPAELYMYEQARELSISLLKEWLVKYKFKNWKITKTRKLKVTREMRVKRAEEIAKTLNKIDKWNSHGRGIHMAVLRRDLKLLIRDFSEIDGLSDGIKDYHRLLQDYLSTVRYSWVVQTPKQFTPLGACLSNQKLPASYTAYCGSLLYAPQYVTRKPITRTRS